MVSRNLLIIAFFLTSTLYTTYCEPRDVQFGARGLSANKKSNGHQIIFNNGDNETTKDEIQNSILNNNRTKNEQNSTKSFQNSTIPSKTEKINTSSVAMVTTERPENQLFDLPSVSDAFQLPKLDLAGWGWDSEMARVTQVMIGLGLYLFAMFIKGLLISWGIGEIKRSVADKISSANSGTDALFDIVQFALTQAVQKYTG